MPSAYSPVAAGSAVLAAAPALGSVAAAALEVVDAELLLDTALLLAAVLPAAGLLAAATLLAAALVPAASALLQATMPVLAAPRSAQPAIAANSRRCRRSLLRWVEFMVQTPTVGRGERRGRDVVPGCATARRVPVPSNVSRSLRRYAGIARGTVCFSTEVT
jgi:hypothetical protein